jgi:N-carbamoyl-L-amino-acid hydrolase
MSNLSPETVRERVWAERRLAEDLFSQLAEGSRADPGVTRDPYGRGEDFAHAVVATCARELGLRVSSDAAANTYMTLAGSSSAAPRVLIGSHLDSVPNGGNFDGAAGVVAGLTSVAALKALGFQPGCDVSVMGIRAEESVWFQVSYIGSRSALGTLPDGALSAKRIDTQRTLAQHMLDCGGDPEAIRRGRKSLEANAIRAFIELHIEQAPSLVESGHPVAIGTGIPGSFRYPTARIVGRYDHVGTPRRFRRDAALAASDFASTLDRVWAEHEAAGIPVAMTFGRFHTDAARHGLTTVPGEFQFSLDVRAYDERVLAGLEARVLDVVREIESRRQVEFFLGARAQAPIGAMSGEIVNALDAAARAVEVRAVHLGSPASHDAAAFASANVPVGMIFVRNENGSHNPDEHMTMEDFLDATSLLAWWLVGESTRG